MATIALTGFINDSSLSFSAKDIEREDTKFNLPTRKDLPRLDNGRHYPLVPNSPPKVASLLVYLEQALRDSSTPNDQMPLLGHQHQVIYRVLSRDIPFSKQVLINLPLKWRSVAKKHLAARREFLKMGHGSAPFLTLPAWRIIAPEPAKKLLAYYQKAELSTGIEWEVLAAVNLVETGMGRIDGVSVANAQGPMQFLPSTWNERGIGNGGNIRDPHDSIQAAARYLVRRGGLENILKGLWGYNNSDYYGRAVLLYADLLREDPRAFYSIYHWEIHYMTAFGDIWLPNGYHQKKRIPISTYLKMFPASSPPPTLSSNQIKTERG